MNIRAVLFLLTFSCGVLMPACSEPEEEKAPLSSSNTRKFNHEESLEQLMTRLQSAVFSGDDELVISIGEELFPTQKMLGTVCSSSINPESYELVSKWIEAVKPRNKRDYLKIYRLKEWQTELVITSMTGERMIEEGSAAELEGFHSEALKLAQSGFLRPEVKFWSVEFRKPGDDVGRRFELFIWNEKENKWSFLGPVWRAFDAVNRSRAGKI